MNSYLPHMARINYDPWSSLCAASNAKRMVGNTYDKLIMQYQNGVRTYHNLEHVAHCLGEFDKLRDLCQDPQAVELAIWYHDIIYDTKTKDNEENSGQRALIDLTVMGVDEVLAHDVKRLILLTKHDCVPTDIDGKVMVDVDLSILGQSPEVFDRYENNVRAEYSWVPDEIFWERRAEFILDMLLRNQIFYTDRCIKKFGWKARQNLVRSFSKERKEI